MSRLGAFLVQEGILTAADRKMIKRESLAFHGSFARSVLAMRILDEDELSSLLAAKTGCQQVAKDILHDLDPEVAKLVSLPILTWLEVLPLSVSEGLLRLAMVDTTDQDAINQIKFFTGLRIRPMIARQSEIRRGLRRLGATYEGEPEHALGLFRGSRGSVVSTVSSKIQSGASGTIPVEMGRQQVNIADPMKRSMPAGAITGVLKDMEGMAGQDDIGLNVNEPEDPSLGLEHDSSNHRETVDDTPLAVDGSAVDDLGLETSITISENSQTNIIEDIATENLAASQAPVQFEISPQGSTMDQMVEAPLAVSDVESNTDRLGYDADLTESKDFEQNEPTSLDDVLDSNEAIVDNAPQQPSQELVGSIEAKVSATVDEAQGLSDLAATDERLRIGLTSHKGIARLNRILVSLQMTSDVPTALKKVAEGAIQSGLNEGTILILSRDARPEHSVCWTHDGGAQIGSGSVPDKIGEDAVKKILAQDDREAWFSFQEETSPAVSQAIVLTAQDRQLICLIAFGDQADHPGIRQALVDVMRAIPLGT